MFQKILYINSPHYDFLSDGFLIGLRQLFGNKVIEWNLNRYIYKTADDSGMRAMHGKGFTLYNLLDLNNAIEYDNEFNLNEVDLFIFGSIYRQSDVYDQLQRYLNFENTIILDGEDSPALYPYYFLWKKPSYAFYTKIHKKHLYFKREIIPKRTNYYLSYKLVPKFFASHLHLPKNLLSISLSIPEDKIIKDLPEKRKLFGKHIVDEEVAKNVEGSMTKHAFTNEADYYDDLRKSKFGITIKRNGWDCLRHYEIAASGTVICFKNLEDKPVECAPHGLIPGVNCISYRNYNELIHQVNSISENEYKKIQENSLRWVITKTCNNIARETLETFRSKLEQK